MNDMPMGVKIALNIFRERLISPAYDGNVYVFEHWFTPMSHPLVCTSNELVELDILQRVKDRPKDFIVTEKGKELSRARIPFTAEEWEMLPPVIQRENCIVNSSVHENKDDGAAYFGTKCIITEDDIAALLQGKIVSIGGYEETIALFLAKE